METTTQTTTELKARSWRFDDEAFNNGNLEVIDELIHPNFVNHDPLPGQELAKGSSFLANLSKGTILPHEL